MEVIASVHSNGFDCFQTISYLLSLTRFCCFSCGLASFSFWKTAFLIGLSVWSNCRQLIGFRCWLSLLLILAQFVLERILMNFRIMSQFVELFSTNGYASCFYYF